LTEEQVESASKHRISALKPAYTTPPHEQQKEVRTKEFNVSKNLNGDLYTEISDWFKQISAPKSTSRHTKMPEVILRYARKEVFLGVNEQEIAMSAPQTEAEQRWMLQSGFNASVLTMCLQTESFTESMNN
jgi:hypothetical protein